MMESPAPKGLLEILAGRTKVTEKEPVVTYSTVHLAAPLAARLAIPWAPLTLLCHAQITARAH
jgi:hypothetical protein